MNNNKIAVDLQKIKEDVIQTYNALITDIEHASDFRDRSEQTNRLKEYVSQTEQIVSRFFQKGR
ncbi:hypothetical protein [Desulfolucanica intricata]|uniref:hypothetical protein n=1 Tax=Desulfolucanica intricata TaxID=1285191 RepID=UPI0008362CF2|nr:hypothetical protein [Desulfolucanica intricata]